MRSWPLAAAIALSLAAPARASFEDLGAGARGPGMGDAVTALADDAYATHYNPAGLAQLERPQFSAAYSRLYVGLSDGSDLGASDLTYAHPLKRGRQGTLGVSWDRFALNGLYNEQTVAAAYGRRVWESDDGPALLAGASLKMLSHSFSPGPEASNACDQGLCGFGKDPVLGGKTSKTAFGADLGLIYRFPRRFQAGLAVQNANEPNAGFSGSDKVRRAYNLGLAYRSLWLSLVGELKQRPSASGGTARDAVFAAERFYPTLDYGQFGLRGSLGWGLDNSGWRQMTVGGAYRINKIQFDYAFAIPFGGVAGQSGSHRVSLTYHFGAPTADEELSQDLLAQAKRQRERGPDYGYEYSQELKPQDLADPRLAEVRRLIEERRYRVAKKALVAFAERQPLSQALIRLSNRLDLVAYYYADLPAPKDGFDATLVAGLRRVFYGEDRLAMLQTSYAYSQKPDDARLGHLLDDLEKALGLKATRLAADHPRGFIEELLYQVEFANTRGDAARAEALLNDLLVLEPQNATALERLGSLRYVQGRLPEAIAAWEGAEKVEMRDRELESLRAYLKLARERAAGKPLPGGGAVPMIEVPAAPPAAPVAAPAEPSTATVAPPRRPPAPARAADPREVERLYQNGVEHYARGEYLQASAMFLHILQIDPENDQARKALERIDRLRPKR